MRFENGDGGIRDLNNTCFSFCLNNYVIVLTVIATFVENSLCASSVLKSAVQYGSHWPRVSI